ncbi:MAG: hypothetical protein LKF42_08805 [Streptococcaceae bacterium]|jgi:hypothetical protein|nr:hypothetical protein [Streptococcaceae bacterium]MCH4177277.1 hypothetical protein [Streptococcaceae bacterium]
MSENNQVNIDDVILSSIELNNAIIGLNIYVNDHVSSCDNLSANDINGLNGLVATIHALGDYHSKITIEVLENGTN